MPDQGSRLLLLTDKFAPHRGGTAVVYTEWCRRLREEVTVLTCALPGTDWQSFDRQVPFRVERVPFLNVPKVRFPLAWAWMHLRAPGLVRAVRPDVLHAGQVLETGLSCLSLKRRFRLPLVVHTYGEEIQHYRQRRLPRKWMTRVLQGADAVTTISEYTRRNLLELGVAPEKIHFQYPGVDAAAFAGADGSEVRRRHGLGNRPVLVTVSRILERKGHDVVLRALPRIAAAVPEVAYLVAGTGPREPVLRRLAGELGVAERVVFAGRVPDEELADYYGAADVFIHPNRELPNGDVEGFGIVFLEANAAGKPVIGGNSGGTPDAVVDGVTGFLIDPNDVDAVADAAIRLLTDRDLARKLGEQGRERARTEFTWERAVERLRALNRKVVAEYRHPGEHKQ